jgi:hypothetical protein
MAQWPSSIAGGPATVCLPLAVRQRFVQLSRNTYASLNHHHRCEKLIERKGSSLSRETLRRLLRNGWVAPMGPRVCNIQLSQG